VGAENGTQRTPSIFAVNDLLSYHYRLEPYIKPITHAVTYVFLIGLVKSAGIGLYARLQTLYC
jgi:hypothetical protein